MNDAGGLQMLKGMAEDEMVAKLGMREMVVDAVGALGGT